MQIYHTCGSLQTYFSFRHDGAEALQGRGVAADDVEAMFHPWLPEAGHVKTRVELLRALEQEVEFVPPGELVDSYTSQGRTFDIFFGTIDTPGLVEFHTRLQLFTLWWIEAASYIGRSSRQTVGLP